MGKQGAIAVQYYSRKKSLTSGGQCFQNSLIPAGEASYQLVSEQ